MNLKITLLFLLLPVSLSAQQDLTQDRAFFEEQAQAYDRWLDATGLGDLLSVREITVEPNALSLYLSFPVEEINYVFVAWETLKTDFQANESLTLEQQLFYKALHYMQVDQEQLDVQLYDTYDVSKTPLFFRGIYFSDGQVTVSEDNPKSVTREVKIPKPQLSYISNGTQVRPKQGMEKDFVFWKILQRARGYYEAEEKKVDGRVPVFKSLGQLDNLRFEVTDLTREVVTDGRRSTFCGLIQRLGYECNWSPREVLTYTISFEEKEGELVLQIEIDGRLGSGVYASARRRSYISLDVEYYPQLEAYAEEMRERIYGWLTRP